MPARKEGLLVLYPEYFDSHLSKNDGRRVPKSLSKPGPKLEDLVKAVRAADPGLEPRPEPKRAHSRHWSERRGRVLVRRKYTKQKTLLMVARKL